MPVSGHFDATRYKQASTLIDVDVLYRVLPLTWVLVSDLLQQNPLDLLLLLRHAVLVHVVAELEVVARHVGDRVVRVDEHVGDEVVQAFGDRVRRILAVQQLHLAPAVVGERAGQRVDEHVQVGRADARQQRVLREAARAEVARHHADRHERDVPEARLARHGCRREVAHRPEEDVHLAPLEQLERLVHRHALVRTARVLVADRQSHAGRQQALPRDALDGDLGARLQLGDREEALLVPRQQRRDLQHSDGRRRSGSGRQRQQARRHAHQPRGVHCAAAASRRPPVSTAHGRASFLPRTLVSTPHARTFLLPTPHWSASFLVPTPPGRSWSVLLTDVPGPYPARTFLVSTPHRRSWSLSRTDVPGQYSSQTFLVPTTHGRSWFLPRTDVPVPYPAWTFLVPYPARTFLLLTPLGRCSSPASSSSRLPPAVPAVLARTAASSHHSRPARCV